MRHFRCLLVHCLNERIFKQSTTKHFVLPRKNIHAIWVSHTMIRRFASKPSLLTMARNFHRRRILPTCRDYKRDAIPVIHQISKSERSVFDTKRRSNREQPKRHRSDDIRDKAKNTGENNELSQKEEFMIRRNDKRIVVDRNNFENSRAWPASLKEKIEEMLEIEEHHVIYFEDITNVEWCPKFVKPEIHGHVRGGNDLRHHRCRDCGRLCFHLLGRPGSKRQCLKCSGRWDEKYIPVWYYHKGCKYCGKKWTSSYRKKLSDIILIKLVYLFSNATWLNFRIYLLLLTGWPRNVDNYKFRILFFKALLQLILGERTLLATQRKGNRRTKKVL